MIIFYGFNFSPPMAIIPLILNIIPLIIYSIYQKQFFDFVDLESKESKEMKEMVKIQEIQDIPAQMDFLKRGELNISFNGDKLFEEEKNIEDLKLDFDKDSDSDEENKKKHENLINNFNDKKNYNKISNEPQEDSEIEGMKTLIDLVGGESKDRKDITVTPTFPRIKNKKISLDNFKTKSFNQSNKKSEQKKVEMQTFEEKPNE